MIAQAIHHTHESSLAAAPRCCGRPLIRPHDHALVVGLGKSGLGAVKFLLQQEVRVSVSETAAATAIDPRVMEYLAANDVSLETGGHSAALFTSVDLIVISPGVPLSHPALIAAQHRSIPVIGEMALAAGFIRTPTVAITGTNGKTTVTTLIGDLCRAAGLHAFVGGNIGTPLIDYLLGDQDADIAIVEVSSFQLDSDGGTRGPRPEVALLLNISPDHLDRYDSMDDYIAAKFSLFAGQRPRDAAILNSDDPTIRRCRHLWPTDSRLFFFGHDLAGHHGARITGNTIVVSGITDKGGNATTADETYDLAGTTLAAPPNRQNAAAAILAARLMGCPPALVRTGLTSFSPLPHRLQVVAEIAGVLYINDSKATNIGAVEAALAAMDREVVLIAGGRDKGGDYRLLADIVQQKVGTMVLIGEASDAIALALAELTRIELADSLEQAVQLAALIAKPGETVLFSPACSSFDMFTSYTQRGDAFINAVQTLHQAFNSASSRSLGLEELP